MALGADERKPSRHASVEIRRPLGPWFKSFGNAKDIHEKREVARGVAEWADGDSVAARNYGYGNDFFCSLDSGKGESKRGRFGNSRRC